MEPNLRRCLWLAAYALAWPLAFLFVSTPLGIFASVTMYGPWKAVFISAACLVELWLVSRIALRRGAPPEIWMATVLGSVWFAYWAIGDAAQLLHPASYSAPAWWITQSAAEGLIGDAILGITAPVLVYLQVRRFGSETGGHRTSAST